MPAYRIHRLKEQARQQFRWAPHSSGASTVKPKDYEPGPTLEASSVYGLWTILNGTPERLQIGDIVEAEAGELRIYKYVGFEEARWLVPEVKVGVDALGAAAEAGASSMGNCS